MAIYDTIGTTYGRTRRPDLRIEAQIQVHLGAGATVANIGAGTGSYETGQTIVAIEPSAVMIAQRPVGAAPAVQARAEQIPLGDGSVDTATAFLTVHHWADLRAGLAELRRISRRSIVLLTWDRDVQSDFWLVADYLPDLGTADYSHAISLDRLADALGDIRVETVPVPADCTDGFGAAYWRRPEAYLDPAVRAGISLFSRPGYDATPGLDRLAADLASGRWYDTHADLLRRDTYDAGYRLVIADLR